jgi:hypothetical protein
VDVGIAAGADGGSGQERSSAAGAGAIPSGSVGAGCSGAARAGGATLVGTGVVGGSSPAKESGADPAGYDRSTASLVAVEDGGASVGAGATEGTDSEGGLVVAAACSGVASADAIGGPCTAGLTEATARDRALARVRAEATGSRLDRGPGAFGRATVGLGSGVSGETWATAGAGIASMAAAAKTSNLRGAGTTSPSRTSASSAAACSTMDQARPDRTRARRLGFGRRRALEGRGDGVGLRKYS